jgi:hypothetical protein
LLNKDLGISLSSGYLYAPNGSSKNVTWGVGLDFHKSSNDWQRDNGESAADVLYRGYRFNLFGQTEHGLRNGDRSQGSIRLWSMQFDDIVDDHFYVPIQASVADTAYFGTPGYGQLLVGLGVQSKYSAHDRFQAFAQLLAGTDSKGGLLKPAVGLDVGLTDQLALFAQFGTTLARPHGGQGSGQAVSSPMVGLGISYRFSLARK